MNIHSKRGSEIVEASIVLPLLILTLLSAVMITLFTFTALKDQSDMHNNLSDYVEAPVRPFYVRKESKSTSMDISGAVDRIFRRKSSSHVYEINESSVILAGELITGGAGNEKKAGKEGYSDKIK